MHAHSPDTQTGLAFHLQSSYITMDSSSCLTGILAVCVSRYFWAVVTDLGMACSRHAAWGRRKEWRQCSRAGLHSPSVLWLPERLHEHHLLLNLLTHLYQRIQNASVASISTNSSLIRLKFSTPEDCLRLNSFANFQAWLVQLFLRIRWGEEKYRCCLAQKQTFPLFPQMKHSFGTLTQIQRAEICTGPVTWGKDRIEV